MIIPNLGLIDDSAWCSQAWALIDKLSMVFTNLGADRQLSMMVTTMH